MKTVSCINVARETGHAVLSLDGAEYAVNLDDLQKILSDIPDSVRHRSRNY